MTAMPTIDPLKFKELCWPEITFYRRQREIIRSVRDNEQTYVPAANETGKDFVNAFIALWFFCSRRPVMVVTTSVKEKQLEIVLWGEIRRLVSESRVKLPLIYNHLFIRHLRGDGAVDPQSALTGEVSRKGEGLLGRHIARGPDGEPRTFALFDEASAIDDVTFDSVTTWAHRILVIGNTYPCTNFFFRGVKGGDKKAIAGKGLFRKVLRIKAEESPNARLGLTQAAAGKPVTNEVLVPGLVDYPTYLTRRREWDRVHQCIGLDAEFYEGAEALMFPPEWLNLAEQRARELKGVRRVARAIGIDPGEGKADTADYVVDELGVVAKVSRKTPDTSIIPGHTIALMREYGVKPENVLFDRGGGGKQHADRLRAQGYDVRTVGFGESATPEIHRGSTLLAHRKDEAEVRYAFKNRRAEMYWMLRRRLNPDGDGPIFAIPAECAELRRQLAPIPLLYDGEGRHYLPPKNKRSPGSTEQTMTDLIGCSPDEADALVLAVYGLKAHRTATAGAVRMYS